MSKQRFEVVQDTETGRVELFEDGVAFMSVEAKPDLRMFLMNALYGNHSIGGVKTEATAALIEEVLTRQYDGTKARVLTLLETVTGNKGIGNEPAGRMLQFLMDQVQATLWDVVERHAPEITKAMVDEARNARGQQEWAKKLEEEAAAIDADDFDAGWRIQELRRQVERLESKMAANDDARRRRAVIESVRGAGGQLLADVEKAIGKHHR